MTRTPRDGAAALSILDHDRYRLRLENAAAMLEVGVKVEPTGRIRIWRDEADVDVTPADLVVGTEAEAIALLYGAALAVQGDWTP